ncbi:MAG: hypothetical protein ACRBN8_40675 [Nannocystales bacterium]
MSTNVSERGGDGDVDDVGEGVVLHPRLAVELPGPAPGKGNEL